MYIFCALGYDTRTSERGQKFYQIQHVGIFSPTYLRTFTIKDYEWRLNVGQNFGENVTSDLGQNKSRNLCNNNCLHNTDHPKKLLKLL